MNVPYYSQMKDVRDPYWKNKACGIVVLKMALDYFNGKITTPNLEELINEGQKIGAFSSQGWIHDGLVFIAHNHGLPAHKEEFRSTDPKWQENLQEIGLIKIKKNLKENNPVVVSVTKQFALNGAHHLVLLTGADDEGFYYHDPDSQKSQTGANLFIEEAKFLKNWRRLAIFFYKKVL